MLRIRGIIIIGVALGDEWWVMRGWFKITKRILENVVEGA